MTQEALVVFLAAATLTAATFGGFLVTADRFGLHACIRYLFFCLGAGFVASAAGGLQAIWQLAYIEMAAIAGGFVLVLVGLVGLVFWPVYYLDPDKTPYWRPRRGDRQGVVVAAAGGAGLGGLLAGAGSTWPDPIGHAVGELATAVLIGALVWLGVHQQAISIATPADGHPDPESATWPTTQQEANRLVEEELRRRP